MLPGLLFAMSLLAAPTEPYAWPLEQPRALTSSFGEYRVDRFHMGIDLRTGPVGKDVFAAEAGYVARVRCSPYGYGKVVYVQLNDGNMAIYAHLSDFMPELRAYVRKAQHDRQEYTVDLYPDAGSFPVIRGELIGKSGQTGIGVPHLHWEIRDSSGVPINPRLLGLSWPDSTTPRFRRILVVPATPETTINGDYLPVVASVTKTATGEYAAAAIDVEGTVVFGVDLYDPANGGTTKLGVHRIDTRVDGESVFEMRHDRIGYVHAGDGRVAYHPYYLDKGRFLMQWPWPGIATELYGGARSGGEVRVEGSPREVVIEATDFFGHSARTRIALRPVTEGDVSLPSEPSSGTGTGTVLYDAVGDWLLITVRFSEPESQTPILLESGRPLDSTVFDRVSATTFRARYLPEEGASIVGLSIDHPRAGLDARSEMLVEHRFLIGDEGGLLREGEIGGVGLEVKPDSVYGRLYVTTGTAIGTLAPELTPVGPGYRIWPERGPLRGGITVTLPWRETQVASERVGVYSKGKKSWQWVPATRDGAVVRFETQHLGTFQLMADSTVPMVQFRAPGSGGQVGSVTPSIKVLVDDQGSGISDWRVTYAGEWLLMAYDPEQKLLIWEQDVPLLSGRGDLVVTVRDKAGNEAVQTMALTVPGR